MIIDINHMNNFALAAGRIEAINSSYDAADSDMEAQLFQIDPTVTLNNGNHPVVATTIGGLGTYTLSKPTGELEESLKGSKYISSLIQLIQPNDDSKVSEPFFDFLSGMANVVHEVCHVVDSLHNDSIIGVVCGGVSIEGYPLFIIRFDKKTNKPVVEVFSIKED